MAMLSAATNIDAEEFYRLFDGMVVNDITAFNIKLQERQELYNFGRAHSGLDGQAPYERLRQKP